MLPARKTWGCLEEEEMLLRVLVESWGGSVDCGSRCLYWLFECKAGRVSWIWFCIKRLIRVPALSVWYSISLNKTCTSAF